MNDSHLFSFERPSRYLGGESGSVKKDPASVSLRFALAFPDIYEVGMSHIGHMIIYNVLNIQTQVYAERVYTPWTDAIDLMKELGRPLQTLETRTPLSEFDVIGFTLAYELSATNVLAMLDMGQVPILSKDRADHDPIVIAGGPCTLNPEPMSIFIDAFLVGDGEQAAVEIAECLIKNKGQSRGKKLRDLAKIAGVYVPSLYEVTYREDGNIKNIIGPDLRPRRRILPNLTESPYPDIPLLPHAKPVHDRLSVEVARGCTRGCRFCQAGYNYRPVREREAADVARIIQKSLDAGGFEEVSFLSLSTGDYSCIAPLLTALIEAKSPERISVSLPSLRVESLTEQIIDQISRVKRTGFTLAPEAGSERLRAALNKDFSDDDIVQTVEKVFNWGWSLIKLYFMIGLPTETEDDIDAIVALTKKALKTARGITKRARITINVSAFVPKPHTPFQWEKQIDFEKAQKTLDKIKSSIDRGPINIRWHKPKMSALEGAISRGNRNTGKAILAAYENGCRFDAWDEHFDFAKWTEAFEQAGMNLNDAAVWAPAKDGDPPWSVVDSGVKKEYFLQELNKAKEGDFTADCRVDECGDCGVCGGEIDVILADKKAPGLLFPPPKVIPNTSVTFKYRLGYQKTGRSRFLAHLELSQAIHRTLRKAKLPLAFSQGFSPSPKVAFGPPLPLGIESLHEQLDIQLTSRLTPEEILKAIDPESLPSGVNIIGCAQIPIKTSSIFDHVKGGAYLVNFENFKDAPDLSPKGLDDSISRFEKLDEMIVEIKRKKKTKIIDLVPLIARIERVSETEIIIKTVFTKKGSVGILHAVRHLFSIDPSQIHRISVIKQETISTRPPKD